VSICGQTPALRARFIILSADVACEIQKHATRATPVQRQLHTLTKNINNKKGGFVKLFVKYSV